jgi:hypothetical protein
LLNAALYFVKRGAPDLLKEITQLNKFALPLPAAELSNIVETVRQWGGNYRCRQLPLAACCQRDICELRQFGVGVSPDVGGIPLELGSLVKYMADEVTWIWSINGIDIWFQAKDLVDQRRFLAKTKAALGASVNPVPDAVWAALVARAVVGTTHVVESDKTMKEIDLWDQFLSFGAASGVRPGLAPFPS